MASIQKKNQRYYIVVRNKWIPAGASESDAHATLDNLLLKSVNMLIDDVLTVQQFLDNWLQTYGKTNLRLTTYAGYEIYINNYLIPQIGNISLKDLKPIDIQNMYYYLIENGRVKGSDPLSRNAPSQSRIGSACIC